MVGDKLTLCPVYRSNFDDDEATNISDLSGLTDFKLEEGAMFNNNDVRMTLVDSVVQGLNDIGTGIDRMRANSGDAERAIELVEKRLLHLKEKEKEAISDMETAMELLSRHSSMDKVTEFDDVILKIRAEIRDVEAQEGIMKMCSLRTQADLDEIAETHTEARTIIAKTLFQYEAIHRNNVEEIEDKRESWLLKDKALNKDLEDVIDNNTDLRMEVEYMKKELEMYDKRNTQNKKLATEIHDFAYVNKIMREQLKSVRQDLQLSEKRETCVSEKLNLLKEKNESGSYCNSYLDHHLVKNIQEFINNGCTTKNFLREKSNTAGTGVHSVPRRE
eukprot:CAMPEP_0194268262 /NCGR_PEP_ID=MMETSP0169-20130528/2633_1 /TAXON_ID=218684 /ORGANISM="Corethron pennatum, Strain L29A3" /LENGTH=331 /DNA_ID=CAMNT_0039009441 /DNA_START=229 /DNA_END=1224 /DNA_ORIENTATION=+